jgi:spore maturation protein CgeB
MKIRLFYHSLISDWNHGNAHFLRGLVSELVERGHDVKVFEPRNGWSAQNLVAEHGEEPLRRFAAAYPGLKSVRYHLDELDLERALRGADLVIVHEWNDHALVRSIGQLRRRRKFVLLFHDTHHRLVTQRDAMRSYELEHYDGVLAYGRVLAELYVREQLARRVWTWHEAADTRVFRPHPEIEKEGDLVWIGNWGDEERTEELHEFLIRPVQQLGLKAAVYGVRYPASAQAKLAEAGIAYRGWLPNFSVPEVFARYRVTLHVPRRPYVQALPGIPTIRPFEALACGIPLVCSPWKDAEHLFTPGKDFLVVRDGKQMQRQLAALLADGARRRRLAAHGLTTIRSRHSCAHRVDELLAIHERIRSELAAAKKIGAPVALKPGLAIGKVALSA